ncbi:MAG: long-chain-fatty-acid--CoA ligase [Steroidobacteraceae bacterium]
MPGLTISDLYARAVLHGGDRVALVQGARRVTYRELGHDAACVLGALQALGVGRGERIAFAMANCPEYVVCEYAVAMAGAVRVPLAVLLGDEDLVYMMNFARCTTLVYHAKFARRVQALAPRLETVRNFVCVADDPSDVPPGHLRLQSLIADHAPARRSVAVDADDLAAIYFTGGTTGRPKGVMLSHRAWFHTYYVELLEFGIGCDEVFVFATPITHASGCLILPVLLRQGRCVILGHFEAGLLLDTIARERATMTLLVPTMIYMLLDHPGRDRHDLRSLRNVLYGAAAIAPERLKEALAAFGPIFTQFFGQTEAPMALTVLPREAHLVADADREAQVLTSAGRATYPTEIRLVDDEGRDVPRGEAGEVIARAPNMMSGYLDDPEATARAIRDGWLHTGDVARMDDEGFITIVDRKKDMIVSGGFNVFPREVEQVLQEHPAVSQAVVFGVPHEKWGEAVSALVVLRAGEVVSGEALREFVKARKGAVAAPKSVEFAAEVPLTNLGKVDRKAIRARHWGGRARQV